MIINTVYHKNYAEVLECRRFGLSTFWGVDVLVCRRFGLSPFRFVDVLVCRRFGLSTFGLSTFWFVDVSVCRRFGLSTFWLSTFRFVDVLTSNPFAQRQQAVGLFFDLEKAYETTWQYGIIRDLHKIGLRGRLPVFVSEYLRDRRIRVRIGTTLSDEFYPEEGVPTGGVLAVTCFGLKINELPSCIAKDIFKALFVDDLAICFRGRSLDTIERHLQQAVNAIQEWATRNGFRFAAHKCKVIHFTAPRSRAERPPIVRIGNTLLPVEESTRFLGLWWDSHLSFKKHISVLKTQ